MFCGFRSVRTRYILTGFAICAVSLLLVSLFSYLISLRFALEQLETGLRESALRNAAELDGWFRKYEDIVEGLAEDVEISGDTEPADLLGLLRGKLKLHEENIFDFYFAYEDPRRPFISAEGWIPPFSYDPRGRVWYRQARRSASVIFTKPYVDAQTGKTVITLARRIRVGGRLVGVLAVDIQISRVIDIVRRYRLGGEGYAFLLDEDGHVVSHPGEAPGFREKGTAGARLPGDYGELLKAFSRSPAGLREMRDYDGRKAYFMLSRIPSNGWIFGVSIPREDYLRPLGALMMGFVFAFLISMVLGAFIMLRLVEGMIRPIRSLAGVIRAFSGGNLGARTEIESEDEIGELGKSFNDMADTIQEYGLSLERKVEERTRELQEKNSRIQESIEYAKVLQESILPGGEEMDASLGDHFVIWEPRDTVGGDFYWVRAYGDGFLLVLGDCTGHGVPGALMTMAAKAILDRVVTEEKYDDPAAILGRFNGLLFRMLEREGEGHVQDGLDAGVLFVDREGGWARFAGAGLSLLRVEDGAAEEIRGDRRGLGADSFARNIAFACRTLEIRAGTGLYMGTDGIRDQVGQGGRPPFGRTRLNRLIVSVGDRPMREQGDLIREALREYRGDEPVRDDLTLIGFRV